MFGKNPIMKAEKESLGRALRVVEGSPFYTIQGEGPFAGSPAIFIRLHGCNLACWFCDTEFSSPKDPEVQTVRLARNVYDMIHLAGMKADLIVITGGEPMRQNIVPLVDMLLKQGLVVQIETAGTLWPKGLEEHCGKDTNLHIVVSPKTGSVHPMILKHAAAFKYVVAAETQFSDEGWPYADTQKTGRMTMLAKPEPDTPVYLSPCDEYEPRRNKRNLERVVGLSLMHGHIAGVQLHKLFGLD